LQHGMRGEEGREHHDVAEYKDPEAVADDHAFRGRAAFAAPGCIDVSPASAGARPVTAAPDPLWIARALEWGVGRAHARCPGCCASHRSRACRRSWSYRAPSSAGIEYSTASRHANHTNTA